MPGYHAGFLEDVVPTTEIVPADRAGGTVNGAGVDMTGYDGVVFLINVGVIIGAGTLDARAVGDELANFASPTNIVDADSAGLAAIAQVTNTAPNTVHVLNVFRPPYQYVRLVHIVTTNNVASGVVAIRYRAQGRTPPTWPNGAEHVGIRAS